MHLAENSHRPTSPLHCCIACSAEVSSSCRRELEESDSIVVEELNRYAAASRIRAKGVATELAELISSEHEGGLATHIAKLDGGRAANIAAATQLQSALSRLQSLLSSINAGNDPGDDVSALAASFPLFPHGGNSSNGNRRGSGVAGSPSVSSPLRSPSGGYLQAPSSSSASSAAGAHSLYNNVRASSSPMSVSSLPLARAMNRGGSPRAGAAASSGGGGGSGRVGRSISPVFSTSGGVGSIGRGAAANRSSSVEPAPRRGNMGSWLDKAQLLSPNGKHGPLPTYPADNGGYGQDADNNNNGDDGAGAASAGGHDARSIASNNNNNSAVAGITDVLAALESRDASSLGLTVSRARKELQQLEDKVLSRWASLQSAKARGVNGDLIAFIRATQAVVAEGSQPEDKRANASSSASASDSSISPRSKSASQPAVGVDVAAAYALEADRLVSLTRINELRARVDQLVEQHAALQERAAILSATTTVGGSTGTGTSSPRKGGNTSSRDSYKDNAEKVETIRRLAAVEAGLRDAQRALQLAVGGHREAFGEL